MLICERGILITEKRALIGGYKIFDVPAPSDRAREIARRLIECSLATFREPVRANGIYEYETTDFLFALE